MDGSAELRQLADLLRIAATTAQEIIALRKDIERDEIYAMAIIIEDIANRMDSLTVQRDVGRH